MYTGTLIDQLIATVELAEDRVRERESSREADLTEWAVVASYELQAIESNLLGVA
jgi:hypothetical protein